MKTTKADIDKTYDKLRGVVRRTPLEYNDRLSKKYGAKIWLKREDMQEVRSYKIRGAYNKISSLSEAEKSKGVVAASAGNHAQGVAKSCSLLKVRGVIFMPTNTPKQKVDATKKFGGKYVNIELVGDTFDEAKVAGENHCQQKGMTFVHPFDDENIIAGQGTVMAEIIEQWAVHGEPIEAVIVPIGGGGLVSGVGLYADDFNIKVYGCEPAGAASMQAAIKAKKPVSLDNINTFVDGAAVIRSGDLTTVYARKYVDKIVDVEEGRICQEMIEMYQRDGVIAEPAGAMGAASLDALKSDIKGKNVVVIVSGGNNDISRYAEIIERSLIYQGLKQYFVINFPQRSGALKSFLEEALGPDDDITLFEYTKKNNREFGPALVGIELSDKKNLTPFKKRLTKLGIDYQHLDINTALYRLLV